MSKRKMRMGVLFALIAIVGLLIPATAPSASFKPKTNKDFFKVTARILNKEETSGGSAAILKSDKTGSILITNDHVCEIIAKDGGVVDPPSHVKTAIVAIKRDQTHDLCLVWVGQNLGINLDISEKLPELGDEIMIAGHPNLMPLILTHGHVSEKMVVTIQYGIKDCEEEDLKDPQNALYCMIYGKIPIFKTREAQVVSATISPGSSGSAVFNSKGAIVGIVFAGSGPLSYGFVVPLEYVWGFMSRSALMSWQMI